MKNFARIAMTLLASFLILTGCSKSVTNAADGDSATKDIPKPQKPAQGKQIMVSAALSSMVYSASEEKRELNSNLGIELMFTKSRFKQTVEYRF